MKSRTAGPRSPAASGKDDSVPVPVTVPAEVWALASLHTQRQSTELLKSLYALISDRTASFEVILERLEHEVDHSIEGEQALWQLFIQVAESSGIQRETMQSMGAPDIISFEPKNGIPFMGWRALTDSIEDKWRRVFTVEDLESGAKAPLTAPFRPVELSKLPPGTVKVPIKDPRHAATIAVDEVLRTAYGDIQNGLAGEDPGHTWGRIRALVTFYMTVVQKWIKELTVDEYKDWLPQLPARIKIQEAASTIARHSTTTVMMQILTMRTVADFYKEAMERAETAHPGDMTSMVEMVLSEVHSTQANISRITEAMNNLHVQDEPSVANGEMEVIFRTVPRGVPVIAIIPREFEDSDRKVTPFPRTL